MERIGTLPIYHPTKDKRVQRYLQKNITTHLLAQGETCKLTISNAIKHQTRSNGNIRASIAWCVIFAMMAITLLYVF